MSLLELQERQVITIEKQKYEILNMTKFREKSSYWVEYKLRSLDNGKMFYLNVEVQSKAILYQILENIIIDLKMTINFQGEDYELYEKGTEKVETYYGMTDIGLNEEAQYYEYVNKNNNKIFLSIEKWKDETEVSLGKEIKLTDIRY